MNVELFELFKRIDEYDHCMQQKAIHASQNKHILMFYKYSGASEAARLIKAEAEKLFDKR